MAAAASFRLAHLADVHVFTWSALASWSLWEPKRLLGALNVALRRGPRAYNVRVLRAACGDARAHAHADHLLVAGDLTNLATAAEFALAARTLRDHYGACARTHTERETLVHPHSDTRAHARVRTHARCVPPGCAQVEAGGRASVQALQRCRQSPATMTFTRPARTATASTTACVAAVWAPGASPLPTMANPTHLCVCVCVCLCVSVCVCVCLCVSVCVLGAGGG
jgi:hypothetical protein